MDNNNLDIEIYLERDGKIMTWDSLKKIMETLIPMVDDFLDIIITLCEPDNHMDLVKRVMEEYGDYFVFEFTLNAFDFNDEWANICRDFGLLPLFYLNYDGEDFDSYLEVAEKNLSSIEGRSRAVIFVPRNNEQLKRLPEVYELVNRIKIVPCFMRLKFKDKFAITEETMKIYHSFIDGILPEYVLFEDDNVQYYNLLDKVRFRTLECPKNYIYRLRLAENSNACVFYPDETIEDIVALDKFYPEKKTGKTTPYQSFNFQRKNFNLKEGTDRFRYKFVNGNRCKNCRLRDFCQQFGGEDMQVDDDFCNHLDFFAYGYFKLREWGESRDLEKYPVRFPVNGVDALGMAATIAQLGEREGVMPPVKVIPGHQVRMKKNMSRISEKVQINPILLSTNVSGYLEGIKDKVTAIGGTDEEIEKIIAFIKRLKIKVFPRDLGVYEGHLYIYNCTPDYRDFEQIDNLLFDSKTKQRKPHKKMKRKTT